MESFVERKEKLCSEPILKLIYNPSLETEVHTDASAIGYGDCLMQKQCDGKMHSVFYLSIKTTEAPSSSFKKSVNFLRFFFIFITDKNIREYD